MKTDLRVIKTQKAIHETFKQMICEMEYKDITVKELMERALISRKTFYLHYQTMDELLESLQAEVLASLLPTKIVCTDLSDIKAMIGMFFDAVIGQSELHERLLCSGSYRFLGEQINIKAIDKLTSENRGTLLRDSELENLLLTYIGSVAIITYRRWVKDGKKIPIEDMKEITYKLLTKGLSAFT